MAPSPIPKSCGMFHTFQGVPPRKPPVGPSESPKPGVSVNKRITTPHACAECKRRKIRCDGKQPCGQCLSSRAPKKCFYDKHRQRVIPSRKTLEALSQSLEEYRSIIKRLYPDHQVSTLLPLSRYELMSVLGEYPNDTKGLPSPPLDSLSTEPGWGSFDQSQICPFDWSSEQLASPTAIFGPTTHDLFGPVSDEKPQVLTASSIRAALLVMLKVEPSLRGSLPSRLGSLDYERDPVSAEMHSTGPIETPRPWTWKGQALIDAYFNRVHCMVPMLDEAAFRGDYLEGKRNDASWACLLNIVFAIGSIVSARSDDVSHSRYYDKAMELLTADSLGSGQLELIQALALTGGFYLHYSNRTSMANAVMAAAVRMAKVMGLHQSMSSDGASSICSSMSPQERTWFSLLCLDTWAVTTMGRPSSIQWDLDVDTSSMDLGHEPQYSSTMDTDFVNLIESIKFCRIARRIHELLAITPLLDSNERDQLDGQLVSWYNNLPPLFRATDPCAEPLFITRCLMKWRYQNLRMLLHRPVLLSIAANDVSPHGAEYDAAAVDICRGMAAATIHDISRRWTRNQMSGWNAVWFLYQAVMVPLVSVYWQGSNSCAPEWQAQIQTVLDLLEAMEDWSPAARHSWQVVKHLHDAQPAQKYTYDSPSTSPGASMAIIDDASFQMSPLELDPSQVSGMLDLSGSWGMDGLGWQQSQVTLAGDADSYPSSGFEAMVSLGNPTVHLERTGGMDRAFSF